MIVRVIFSILLCLLFGLLNGFFFLFLFIESCLSLGLLLKHDKFLKSQVWKFFIIATTEYNGSLLDLFPILHYPPPCIYPITIHLVFKLPLNLFSLPLDLLLTDLILLLQNYPALPSHLSHISLPLGECSLLSLLPLYSKTLLLFSMETLLLFLETTLGLLLQLLPLPVLGCLQEGGWEGVLKLSKVIRTELCCYVVAGKRQGFKVSNEV